MESIPLMEGIFSFCVGLLTASGIYLALRGRTFPVVVGITLLSYAVNLFLFASGRLTVDGAVILGESAEYADPLPQALVLTAIVIGFAMTAFIVILAIRFRADMGNDHVDGRAHTEELTENTVQYRLSQQKQVTGKSSQQAAKPSKSAPAASGHGSDMKDKNAERPGK